MAAFASVFAVGFSSCTSGDEDEPISSGLKDLVSSVIPSEGWTGSSDNGILKFAPYNDDSEDVSSYFAFDIKGGICQSAVYNLVMPSATEARQFAKMFNDGTWMNIDDDDDDDYFYMPSHKSSNLARRVLACIKRAPATRSSFTLPIPVQQDGKVIYIVITNLEGLSVADLREAVSLWTADDSDSLKIPNRVVFGTYENGRYLCHNMHGMNITYEIDTDFNSAGFCTEYVTTLTLPTEDWARFYYEAYESQLDDFEERFGKRPELSRDGKKVRLTAVIFGDVPRADVDLMIYTIDWINNCPFICNIF